MSNTESKISVGIISLGACALTEPERRLPVGGSELQLYLVARELAAQQDFRVTLYVADVGQGERENADLLIRPLVKTRQDLRLTFGRVFLIRRRLARAKHDVYITQSVSGINGLVSAGAHSAGGHHIHMCAGETDFRYSRETGLSRAAWQLHQKAMRRAYLVTCQTERQREQLRRVYGRDGTVVPTLVRPAPSLESSAERVGALWVGRDVGCKQPELFVELARRLPDWNFTMVSQPQPDRDVRRLAENAPRNLCFIPGLPFEETSRLFATHKLLVCTSSAEGFPNTILQAMAAGTPVVSFIVDPDDLIKAHGIGRVCGGDLTSLVGAVRDLMEQSDLWNDCHQAATRWVKERRQQAAVLPRLVRSVARSEKAPHHSRTF